MKKISLFLYANIFLMLTTKSMEDNHIYKLNKQSIKIAYQTTQCSIAWTLKRNEQLNLFKGSTCSSQKNIDELKSYCSALEKIAITSKTTAEFQERSKDIAQSSYCAYTLCKKFRETLNQTLSPFPNKTRHRRSLSENITRKN